MSRKEEPILTEYVPVFSGSSSEGLRDCIEKVRNRKVYDALHEMLQCCWELEFTVDKLQRRIHQLELEQFK